MATMKYPIGIQTFEQLRTDGYVYVDKTDLVYEMVSSGKAYFLNRPRRFGKSLLLSTLDSYFSGRKDLFEGLKIAELEKDWKAYPILRLDFSGQNFGEKDALQQALERFVASAEDTYGKDPHAITLSDRFVGALAQAHAKTGRRAVVLVDEYDKPLLDVMDTDYKIVHLGKKITLEERNRDILKAFYGTFKVADADLQFVFLTGVTKFSQVSVFSGYNQPRDISMEPMFDTLCGISEEEMEHYFAESVQQMASRFNCSYDEMKATLKKRYDGYHFSERMVDLLEPYCLFRACDSQRLGSF